MHHREVWYISQTWWVQGWCMSPGARSQVSLLLLISHMHLWSPKGTRPHPQSEEVLSHFLWPLHVNVLLFFTSDQAVHLPVSIRYALLLEGIWIKHLIIWQAFSSMKTYYELGNHTFNCAACQKSTQTSNSKVVRSFWSTAKISTFPLLVLDAAPTHSTMSKKLWERCSLSEEEKN